MIINPGIIALASGLSAQAAKVVIEGIFRKKWRPSLVVANGGMPSSHTAMVTTLTCVIGGTEGIDSSLFGLVLVFSIFVIFEATGLRQEVGKQAELLNDLMENVLSGHKLERKRLRELVGHTWQEVGGGIIFGVLFWLLIDNL